MSAEELKDCIKQALSDWGGFEASVEAMPDPRWRGHDYFSVTVKHDRLGSDCWILARVNDDGRCEMDISGEDSWVVIDAGNLCAFMAPYREDAI